MSNNDAVLEHIITQLRQHVAAKQPSDTASEVAMTLKMHDLQKANIKLTEQNQNLIRENGSLIKSRRKAIEDGAALTVEVQSLRSQVQSLGNRLDQQRLQSILNDTVARSGEFQGAYHETKSVRKEDV